MKMASIKMGSNAACLGMVIVIGVVLIAGMYISSQHDDDCSDSVSACRFTCDPVTAKLDKECFYTCLELTNCGGENVAEAN